MDSRECQEQMKVVNDFSRCVQRVSWWLETLCSGRNLDINTPCESPIRKSEGQGVDGLCVIKTNAWSIVRGKLCREEGG